MLMKGQEPIVEQRLSRRRQRSATIHDVARHAGVSSMTVSRVINGEGNVRPTTQELVEASIRALHFIPNAAAKTLAGGDVLRIGLLCSFPNATFVSEYLIGALEKCS